MPPGLCSCFEASHCIRYPQPWIGRERLTRIYGWRLGGSKSCCPARSHCHGALDIPQSPRRGSSLDDLDILQTLTFDAMLTSTLTGRATAPSTPWATSDPNARDNSGFRQLSGAALGWESIWTSL